MKADLLVKLYDLNPHIEGIEEFEHRGITFKRALPPDKHKIINYVKNTFGASWADECEVTLFNKPVSCFVAVKDKEVIGFACYEATAKGFFGPMGVSETFRGTGVGRILLLKCLLSMREEGYGYAIIGCVDDAVDFYKKTVNAIVIENSFPGVYGRLINK